MNSLELRCKECDRFLGVKEVKAMICRLRCSNCKEVNNIKVVDSTSPEADIRFKFEVNSNE